MDPTLQLHQRRIGMTCHRVVGVTRKCVVGAGSSKESQVHFGDQGTLTEESSPCTTMITGLLRDLTYKMLLPRFPNERSCYSLG